MKRLLLKTLFVSTVVIQTQIDLDLFAYDLCGLINLFWLINILVPLRSIFPAVAVFGAVCITQMILMPTTYLLQAAAVLILVSLRALLTKHLAIKKLTFALVLSANLAVLAALGQFHHPMSWCYLSYVLVANLLYSALLYQVMQYFYKSGL